MDRSNSSFKTQKSIIKECRHFLISRCCFNRPIADHTKTREGKLASRVVDGGERSNERRRYPWIYRSRALGDSSSRRLGAYPIWKIHLDHRISVEYDPLVGRGSLLETRKESVVFGGPIDCLFTRQTERGMRVLLSNSPLWAAFSWRFAPEVFARQNGLIPISIYIRTSNTLEILNAWG